jgi:hypothetical protein
MDKIVRLLALVGVVSSAAMSPAISQILGRCSYSCSNGNPSERQSYSYSATYQQCCSQDRSTLCDPGWTAIGLAYNGTKCPPNWI